MHIDTKYFVVRNSFIADEGHRLFMFDYDQQEMIVMLDQAEEMPVINKLLSGEFKDFYLATIAVLEETTGMLITRKQAKAIALGLAYGEGADLLAANLGVTREEALTFKNAFFSALPRLKRLDNKLKNQVLFQGKIHNPFGRVSYIRKEKAYKALNSFVQGTSADITKQAMINVHNAFNEEKLESRLSLCVHDELIFNIKIGEENKAIPIIKHSMITAYPYKHISLGVGADYSPINEYGVSAWGNKIPYNEEI